MQKTKVKILVFGTFDGLHKGHLDFFKQARKLAERPFLIVSVARDKNVKRIKGQAPKLGEEKRLALIKKCILVNRAVLAGLENYLPHILKESPNIIALGYDQKAYVKNLKEDLKNKGLIVKIMRLKSYKEHIYKNHLLKERNLLQ
ncbi:MAG: adenylyltransferase/cytidyltransferase family protein [Patescibacteria group bacterium]